MSNTSDRSPVEESLLLVVLIDPMVKMFADGWPAWQMSDGTMDRSDPSEKLYYGRTFILPTAN